MNFYWTHYNKGRIMNFKYLFIILIGASLTFLSGCRTAPIYNVSEQAIVTNSTSYTEADVQKAIVRAGSGLGWDMKVNQPGHITGTLHLRTHMAQVDVKYNKQNYSINYKDSDNLQYDGKIIHKNYNGWVQNLDRAIKVQLNNL